MSEIQPKRIVVFGATGHLGQQLIEKLADSDWPISELAGVASDASAGTDFDFRGEICEVASEWPVLKGWDLVFICTPAAIALEIVREALRAEVGCIDCTGALAAQPGVAMPRFGILTSGDASSGETDAVRGKGETQGSNESGAGEADPTSPLLLVPSGTTLAWAPILESLAVSRVVATVVSGASALGQKGVVALSEESIALFNQSEGPEAGPAGQPVAFDVIPGGGVDCERVRGECRRLFGEHLEVDLTSLQVPAFVGEGASLVLTLRASKSQAEVEALLSGRPEIEVVRDGFGARGLEVVDESSRASIGPTLRDAIGSDQILVGRIEPAGFGDDGDAWRLWLTCDPLRLTADQAMRLGRRRLGLA